MPVRQETQIGLSQIDPYSDSIIRTKLEKIGYEVLPFVRETPSTMLLIQEHALRGGKAPAVAYTDHQTKGVGREETKEWLDTLGCSILLSALFYLKEDAIAEFADMIALRVCLTLLDNQANVLIKAPNDIVDARNGKKVCGILVRNIYDPDNTYAGTNAGIGINVHYTDGQLAEYPTDYGAASLDTINGQFNNRQEILIGTLKAILTAGPEAIVIANGNSSARQTQDRLWQKHSYLLGKNVSVTEEDRTLAEGIVVKTEIGRGITIQENDGIIHPVQVFDTNTKVRLAV